MEVKPGYKMTEVGLIPEDWEVKSLGDLAKIHDGTHQTPKYVPDGIPFYSVEHITSGDFSNTKFISIEEHLFLTRSFKIERGDILMTRIGSIGECCLVDWNVNASFYVSLALLKIFGADAVYIEQYSKSRAFKAEVELHSLPSATPKKINLGPISDIRLPLPPLPEQRAIASALSDVDALLSGLDRLIAKKRDLKQAAMQQLLTGATRLPGFSGEWEVLPAREIGIFKGGSGFPLSAQGNQGAEYPFFKVSDMNNEGNEILMTTANHYISEQTRKRIGATAFPSDSIVFAKVGAAIFLERKRILGQASCIDNNMAAFILDKNRVDVSYIHLLLLSIKLSSLVATTALPALNARQLDEMSLAVPPLPEQSAIAAVLSDMDAELAALEARRDKTRALKQAMMQELLTGRTRLV